MPNYIHKFNNVADFNTAYNGNNYLEPWTSLTKNGVVESFTVTAMKWTTDAEEWETYDRLITCVFTKKIRHDENGNIMYVYNADVDPIFIKTLNFGAGDTISFFYDHYGDSYFDDYSIGEGLIQIGTVVVKDKVNYNKKQDLNNWVEIIPDGYYDEEYMTEVPKFSILSVGSNFNDTAGESTYSAPEGPSVQILYKGQPFCFVLDDTGFIQIDPNNNNGSYYRFVNNNNTWSIKFVPAAPN